MTQPLVEVRDLKVHFPRGNRWMGRRDVVRAVDGVDLSIGRNEILGLVGESGSGKTTLGRAVLRLIEATHGTVTFDGEAVDRLDRRGLRRLRRRMQIVFQDPYTALSPRMQIRQIVAEPLLLHGLVPRGSENERVAQLLAWVGLEPYMMDRYPHEMSGGQRQRIAIARALALEPDFLVADEPVSALDVSVRAQILSILLRLRDEMGITILFVSHDLGVVRRVADRVAVMYGGRIVEVGPSREVMRKPLHPYTQALVSSVPSLVPGAPRSRIPLRGEAGSARVSSRGCPFGTRCPVAEARCLEVDPALEPKAGNRHVACIRVKEEE